MLVTMVKAKMMLATGVWIRYSFMRCYSTAESKKKNGQLKQIQLLSALGGEQIQPERGQAAVAKVLPDGEFEQLPDAFGFLPFAFHTGAPTAIVELSAMAGGDAVEHFVGPVGIRLVHPVGKQFADGAVEPHDGIPRSACAMVRRGFDNFWHL